MNKLLIGLILCGLLLITSVGVLYYNQPEESMNETVCYPAVYSIQNGEVVEIESSKCEVVNNGELVE